MGVNKKCAGLFLGLVLAVWYSLSNVATVVVAPLAKNSNGTLPESVSLKEPNAATATTATTTTARTIVPNNVHQRPAAFIYKGNESKINSNSSDYTSAETIWKTKFPQCYFEPFMTNGKRNDRSLAERWVAFMETVSAENITNLFKYVPSLKSPPYDHITCPVMKARYNCAHHHDPDQPRTPLASDYKFVWRKNNNSGEFCDMGEVIEFMGGPQGIAFQKQHGRTKPISILMQGNSYLRQVWESIVCTFQHQVTNLTIITGGPPTSLAYIKNRHGKLLQRQELGTFIADQQDIIGCHGPSRQSPLSAYYDFNVTVPANIDGCTDDLAMVQFGERRLQIFFLFHPSRYHSNALQEVYLRLGIPQYVDIMIWTNQQEKKMRHTSARYILSFENFLNRLKETQTLSGLRYFGADNPWISSPPDNHPCMPGIPDDEAMLIFFFLLQIDA